MKVIPPDADAKKADEEAKKENDHAANEKLTAYSTVVLAIITFFLAIFTGLLWYITTKLVKDGKESGVRATEIAQATADAAVLHAQAIINSERPWLFITINKPIQFPWQTNVVFTATNQGRTPAEVIMWHVEWTYRESADMLEPTPSYPMEDSEFVHKKYLATGHSFEVFEFNCHDIFNEQSWQEHVKKRRRLIFYGHVVYRDLITREQHESRFCYWLSPAEWVGLIIGGPSEYHKHT